MPPVLGPPVGASWLYELDQGGLPVVSGFLACLVLAVILLLPARRLAFDEPPRARHKPLVPRRRSPLMVAVILIAPPILVFLMGLGVYLLRANGFEAAGHSPLTLLLALLVLAVAVCIDRMTHD